MTDNTDRLNAIRKLFNAPYIGVGPLFSHTETGALLAEIDCLGTDANLACADLAEANRTIAELREQVKAADKVKQLWYMLDDALAAFRDAMEEVEATSNSDPTSSRLEDGGAANG